ncbi:phospholipase D1-like isoform X2 [Ptychodera flava]|uniref:phospholipase D1-like isoform X2 n=1 Tax=Ptychodera flava TaxID=63121 RepID=UPI00396A9697
MKPKMSEPLLREADFDEDRLHDQDMPEKETKMKPNYGTFSNSFLNTNRWPKISLPFLWISSKMTLATPSIQIQINSENETDYSDLEDPGPEHDVDDGHVNATVLDSGDSHLEADREIPYRCVHDDSLPFDDIDRRVLIPGERIVVKITDVDRYPTPQLLNPNLYVIELQHGPYTWTIKKRYHHFRELHDSLLLYKASMKIPVPTKRLKERRRTFRKSSLKNKELPRLPRRLDALVTAPQLARRMVQLEKYLQNLLSNQIYRAHQHTLEFLEVSHLSFINELGEKGKEGAVKKRSGGHRIPLGCCTRCCGGCYCEWAGHWNKRWLITKESYVGYMRPKDGRLCCVVLMDEDFRVSSGLIHTGVHHGLLVTNMTRNLLLKCWTRRKAKEWADYISTLAEKCEYTKRNRYKSFAPVRSESYANWYIDGADYFNAVADSLESAKEEIFITDWWLSPEIYMKRPVTEGNKWRLDQILRRKAESGVKIFVLLYKEVEMALGLKSSYSKLTLRKLHPSIKVMRHPDHVPGGVLLWAHHEKTVVIDQNIAFLGGIDLCYGRWDDFTHRLVDVGSALPTKQSSFTDLTQGALRKFPSTPDHLNTAADSNFNSLQLNIHRKTSFGRLSNTNLEKVEKGFDEIDSVPVGQSNVLAVPKLVTCRSSVDADLDKLGVQGNAKLWYGKDYTNFIAKDFVDLDRPFQDFIDRTTTPRMPWHDIGAVVYGVAARDVSRHFIQRWNATKILRSVSTWSAGIKHTENSIYWAYLDAIKEAKHYIYIENQFFISCHDDRDVFNKIADALYDRIMQAHRAKHKFRVFVVLPLLPAFEGEIGETGGSSILAITHWNYKSICRGGNSLLERLQRDVDQPEEYISFCGLRTYSELDGQPVSELVYVHSKLMIVDDNTVIIGSANINDRSLLGKRDSEMAVIVNDTNTVMSKMNGKDYKAGLYASGLRKHLFKEHLGLMTNPDLNIDITDPVSDTFFKEVWQQTAQHNTEIYDKVFHCIPCDCVTSFDELKQYKSKEPLCTSSPGDAYNELAKVKGFLVKMPLEFLCLENLEPSIATQEGMMPTKLWT